jgi:two-component system, chemotaxis family, protein-glutamate methylesterase/glutaminase
MVGKTIRVLVVDDSAVIRQIISDLIEETPGMTVAGTAADGRKALECLERANPDVITLDVQMPNMNGLDTLDALLSRRALPVIMVSSLTKLGANITFDALERGAIDYVSKPDYGVNAKVAMREELLRKIRTAAGMDVRRILQIRADRKQRRVERPKIEPKPKEITEVGAEDFADKCIALGISTGGPPALSVLFEGLCPPLPPMVVVQHMPPNFTKPLAWRLDSLSKLAIKEVESGDVLKPNHVYIAQGGKHFFLKRLGSQVRAVVEDGPTVSSHKPSVDVLMKSAAEIYGSKCLGVIMTGMGRDGSDGCGCIRERGGYVLGQDEKSSDVYGMNKVAFAEGRVHRQFPLHDAAQTIMLQVNKMWKRELVEV